MRVSFSKSVIGSISISFLISLFFFSCGKDEVVGPNQADDLRYFPLVTGNWIEYTADSIVHLDSDDPDSIDTAIINYHFLIREVVDSSFIDSENQRAYVIIRYKRDYDTLPWELTNVWTAKVDLYAAQRVEDNVRFVRLKFPFTSTTYWNGNAYNYYPDEEYGYSDLFVPKQFDGMDFDSTITVNQNNFVSNINRITKNEIYGAGAGLLFKQLDSVRTANTQNGKIILNGFEYKQSIIGYKH